MYSSPRAVVILATIVAASLLCGVSGLSDTDLVRARTLVPRPQFRGETFAFEFSRFHPHFDLTVAAGQNAWNSASSPALRMRRARTRQHQPAELGLGPVTGCPSVTADA